MDNRIIKYNTNHKRFPFGILSKSEIINFIIELVKKDIIDWKVAVTISQQIQKKFQDILRKGRTKWINKKKINKQYEKKQCIWYKILKYFIKACPHLFIKRSVQTAAIIKKNETTNNQQLKVEELKDSEGSKN